ncbi:unnamed protein product [Kuraishia capsulata CBS 1993]|uniref:THIF-type NAD/FAD binding fold domain-containing protein n=1 Tax=Kuraishia capsulata CBS 1993 TaxID=1382522 RepID=W6MK45_9ASCO|nr:uncharacterized protein KUCA_T00002889001 [Kuraishia capsulata CBS 1993]CDK26914.1 unnamed protein product [Kuraishia capsulata CBS 1993]
MSSSGRLASYMTLTAVLTVGVVESVHFYLKTKRASAVPTKSKNVPKIKYSEELIREQLARNYVFLSEEGMEKVRQQFVVVVGAGGVGSNCVTALVRSGVSKIRIIDFDQVTLSSLNRHAVARVGDVGVSKVECLKSHLLEIAPWVEVEAINELWTIEQAERLLVEGNPTYIVDCIDNIDTKVDLLAFCHDRKLRVISSMGAACKSDPSRINIGDISTTDEDSLARSVRRRLKKRGIFTGIPVVFSAEKPDPRKASLLPLPDEEFEKGHVDELSALKNFRVRILPVMGTMPGMFGLALATYVITHVSGYPIDPVEGKNRYKVYDGILQSLAAQQSRLHKSDQRVQIAMHDINYILEEVFRGKSPISGYSTRLTLSRWDPSKELSLQNCLIMTKEEQKEHEQRVLLGGEKVEDVYPKEVLDLIEKRFAEEKYYSRFR